jgi:hypothetical protein
MRRSERPQTEKWEWRSALNGNDQRRPAPALKELYTKPRRSNAWESEEAEVVRFWTDDGEGWGFLFHYLTAIHYSARHERLFITWTLGTLVIAGPKVLEFYDDFCIEVYCIGLEIPVRADTLAVMGADPLVPSREQEVDGNAVAQLRKSKP